MTITEIYENYTPGSQGFCIAVETHCGYEISREEIERISNRAGTAESFDMIFNDEAYWTDDNN